MKSLLTVFIVSGVLVLNPVFAGSNMNSESGVMSMQERGKKMDHLMQHQEQQMEMMK